MVQGQRAHCFQIYSSESRRISCSPATSVSSLGFCYQGLQSHAYGVFTIRGLDLDNDPVLKNIIKAGSSQPHRPTRDLRPSWNLDVVLRYLTKAPFEPLRLSSTRDLTRKTLFIFALATAQRVGEIQALSHKTSWQGQDLLVSYLPDFIAKTDTETHSTPREFRIKSLSPLVGSEDEERLLCPVRALSLYLHRTALDTRPRIYSLLLSAPPDLCPRQQFPSSSGTSSVSPRFAS